MTKIGQVVILWLLRILWDTNLTISGLKDLPLSIRVLFTAFLLTLSIAYIFALLYLYLIDIEPHKKAGMGLLEATIHKYYGNRGNTRIERAIKGRMGERLSEEEKKEIFKWVARGATKEGYKKIKPIIDQNCVVCHNRNTGLIPLTTYEEVKAITNVDLGESIKALTRVSHIHLFGMSFIFILTGAIFSLSEINICVKIIILVLPFVAIWMDIGSWWFTKYKPVFAYTVIGGGILMALAFGAQVLISLYEMWGKKRSLP